MNIGYSSRLVYDQDYYPDRLRESTDTFNYQVNPDKIYSPDRCLSVLGPRSTYQGHGDSTVREVGIAASQDLTDFESILSNRNVKASRTRRGNVNMVDLSKFPLHDAKICGNMLNPENTALSYPKSNYRDMGINRFYNPVHDPQDPRAIFWDFSINSRLEAKDNFVPDIPQLWPDIVVPDPNNKPVPDPTLRCPKTWSMY